MTIRHQALSLLIAFCALLPTSRCAAQNVNYQSVSEPFLFLFLLREPAVQTELQLSKQQREQLGQLNAKLDGPLLALRNWPADKASKKVAELTASTQQGLGSILHAKQRDRIDQIKLRVRGIRCVMWPKMSEQLQLSDAQREQIEAVTRQTDEEFKQLRAKLQQSESQETVTRMDKQVREAEQREILGVLTDEQKNLLIKAVGRDFDIARLGKVSFRAPPLATGDGWINSQPRQLDDFKGQVLALHFWTYG